MNQKRHDQAALPWTCRLAYLDGSQSLWVAAPVVAERGASVGAVWRVDTDTLAVERIGVVHQGLFAASTHGDEEVAVWLQDEMLHVWRDGSMSAVDAKSSGPERQPSPMRWSPVASTAAWHGPYGQDGGPALCLYTVGEPEIQRIPFPAHAQPVAGTAPVWAGNGRAVRIASGAGFVWYLVAWSLDEGRWHIWERPLPEHPEPGDYVPLGDEKWAGHWSQFEVPAGAPVLLGGMQAFEGGFAAYWLFLPDEFRCVGAAPDLPFTGLTIGAPTDAVKTVAASLCRVVYLCESGPSGRVLEEAIPSAVPPSAPERRLSLPSDAPLWQEVALTPEDRALLLAGSPGNWRVLRADFDAGTVEELVELGGGSDERIAASMRLPPPSLVREEPADHERLQRLRRIVRRLCWAFGLVSLVDVGLSFTGYAVPNPGRPFLFLPFGGSLRVSQGVLTVWVGLWFVFLCAWPCLAVALLVWGTKYFLLRRRTPQEL